MVAEWLGQIQQHAVQNSKYTQRDFQLHFSNKQAQEGLRDFLRQYSHKPLSFFQTSNDWQALIPPAFQSTIAEYGAVDPLPEGLIANVSEDRDHAIKRFIWMSEPIDDYLEGESFKELYIEGGTAVERWRKPAAKISETYESARDLPLDLMQARFRLALNEFRVREWRHFTHELHRSTSNQFKTKSTDKNGNTLDITGWRAFFDNAWEHPDPSQESSASMANWDDVKLARAQMLRRDRDAVRPNILIVNATTEAELSEDNRVNAANVLGGADTFFRTGTLPNIYGLTVVVVPDAHFGYFNDDVNRKNDIFVRSNDAFLITTNNGPTIMRHNREPLSSETWRVFEGQKNAMNMWERYTFGTFRYTNILRLVKDHAKLDGASGRLN